MKSNAERKAFINNMIAYDMVATAYIIIQALVGTGHISSPMKGLLVPFCIYVITAVPLNLTVGILGELSLGHVGFMCVGTFAGALSSECMKGVTDPTPGMVIIILTGAVTTALLGVIIKIPTLRPRGDCLATVTLAFGETIKNLVNAVYLGRDAPGLHISLKDSMSLKLGEGGEILTKGAQGITGTPQVAVPTIGVTLVLITLFIVVSLMNSHAGRVTMAIRDNRIAMKSIGINIARYKLLVFSTSAGLAGIAGVLYIHNLTTLTAPPENFRYNMFIMILIYVVLDGVGNIRGSAITMVILYLFLEMLRGLGNYHMLMYTIVLVLAILFNSAPQSTVMRECLAEKLGRKGKKPAKEAA